MLIIVMVITIIVLSMGFYVCHSDLCRHREVMDELIADMDRYRVLFYELRELRCRDCPHTKAIPLCANCNYGQEGLK